jgi:hypothetical protein
MRTIQKYTAESVEELKEGAISRAADVFYAFRFLRLLTTPWDKTNAFKYGIIDANGKRIKTKKIQFPHEKAVYTIFHKIVFNLKRLLNKVPAVGKTKLASYAAALFLIKENTNMSEKQIRKIMDQVELDLDWDNLPIQENTWFQSIDGNLNPGVYTLVNDIASPDTGDMIAQSNTRIRVEETTEPSGEFLGCSFYKVLHQKTGQEIFIHNGDIVR